MKRERKSWHKEHEEFTNLMNNNRVSNKWILGFYQIIRDPVPPETKLKDNSFEEFLIPESHLSLKLFFDNLRNYGICAALFVLAGLMWKKSPHILLAPQIPDWTYTAIAISVFAMSGVLLLLNCLQTWFLITELHYSTRSIQISECVVYRNGNMLRVILGLFHIIITWITDIIVTHLTLLIAIVILFITTLFVFHLVFSSQGLH